MEKCYLARHVYPQVRQLCQSLSLQCVIVDLFQAVPVTIATPTSEKSVTPPLQTTSDEMMYKLEAKGLLEMARDEIKLCQEVSVGPTFVVSFISANIADIIFTKANIKRTNLATIFIKDSL